MNRFVIDFQVLGNCNMSCAFCAGPAKGTWGPNFEELCKTIDMLVESGVTTVVFTGGEPLLRKDMEDAIVYAKSKGLEVYLSTNTLLLDKVRYSRIKDSLDMIGLPLDGSTGEINKAMTRDFRTYESVTRVLTMFKEMKPKHRVKIGTVVASININDLENIGKHLFENDSIYKPNTWRLYEFSPLGDGLPNHKMFEITTEQFYDAVNAMKKRFPGIDVSELSNEDSNDSYFFIHPTMQLQVLTGDIYKNLGDVRKMDAKTFLKTINDYKFAVDRGSSNRSWLKK
jgi:MoaA/NifB/PqqE/SkfB family radical SAM enzyme